MSSFGGISGGMIAAFVLMRLVGRSPDQIWRFFDCVGFAFPFGWIFGRAGCALAHDHLGVLSSHWLAVRFPEGPRFDLGLLELLYTLAIAMGFFIIRNRPLPPGIFAGLFLAAYGPVRFALDTLRTGDARYLGWTPGQYMSVVATVGGLAMIYVLVRREREQRES
jgi:phosphatidylglycerol:prolipoprotein diacylglycerol transferase